MMKQWASEAKWIGITSCVMLCFLFLASVFYVVYGDHIIVSMIRRESIEALNTMMERYFRTRGIDSGAITPHGDGHLGLEHYFRLGRIYFFRLVTLCLVLQSLVIAVLLRRQLLAVIREFFAASTYPLNLAIFRVVLFYLLFRFDTSDTVWFSQLPEQLQVAPWGVALAPRIPSD